MFMDVHVILYLTIIFLILADGGGPVVINPEQNNTLICPGESFRYSCQVSGNISITWSVQCPGQTQASSLSLSFEQTEDNRSVNCNFNSNMFGLDLHLTYTTTQKGAHSNITIDVPSLNYSVIKAQSVKIGCEDSIYRYVQVPGLPPSPSNLSYSYGVCSGTHVLTTFNWSNQRESRRSLIVSYVLILTSTESDDEEVNITSRSVNTTSITIPLDYQNMSVYTATVHSSSCGEVLESKNNPSVYVNVTFTKCDLITVPSCLKLVSTDYPQLTILNTSNSTLLSYMCMDGMIPEMRMESVCTRNGTWEPDPGQLNCTPTTTTLSSHSTDSVHYNIVAGVITGIIILFLIIVLLITAGIIIRLKTKSFSTPNDCTVEQPDLIMDTLYEEIQRSTGNTNTSLTQEMITQEGLDQSMSQSIEDVDTQNNLLPLVPSSEFEGYADPAELDRHNNQLQSGRALLPEMEEETEKEAVYSELTLAHM